MSDNEVCGHVGGQNKAIKDVEDVGPHDCRGPERGLNGDASIGLIFKVS